MRRFAVLMTLAAACLAQAAAAETSGEIAWTDDPAAAVARAGRDGKPVLADVWAVWCVPCKQMDKTTYADEGVRRAAAGFVPLKIDADLQKPFLEKYRVEVFPTLLVLDRKGNEISRFEGLISAAKLRPALEAASQGFAAYETALGAKDDPAAQAALGHYLAAAGNAEGAVDRFKAALKALPKADLARREPLEVALAEAQVESGSPKAALAALGRLADGASDRALRARALAALARAEADLGHAAKAKAAEERLAKDYADVAPKVTGAP